MLKGCIFYVKEQQEMAVREYANRETSACNGGGNPVLNNYSTNYKYRKL